MIGYYRDEAKVKLREIILMDSDTNTDIRLDESATQILHTIQEYTDNLTSIFRVLQLFCEGHYEKMQTLLVENFSSVNF
jgi:hypothetical protein